MTARILMMPYGFCNVLKHFRFGLSDQQEHLHLYLYQTETVLAIAIGQIQETKMLVMYKCSSIMTFDVFP